MQALMPVFAILGATTAARLTLLPYAYLADPLPVYQQSQDTRTGVHAYSYAGGPSAKEEVRGPDGVTRGSYSYVDANGILQSVFYVADEGGFRVAATNLPTDGVPPVETSEILLAENAHPEEHANVAVKTLEEKHTSRRKRSLEATVDQDHRQPENPSSRRDQADRDSTKATPKSSHELLLQASGKKADVDQPDRNPAEYVYGLLDTVLIPGLTGVATTSHQSRLDIHNNVRLKTVQPVEAIGLLPESAYETVILSGQVPLATSHQSRVQVHNNIRVETPGKLVEEPETIRVQSIQAPAVPAVKYQLEPLVSALPDYNENRIQLHRTLGLEGPNRRNAVKIDAARTVANVAETPLVALPALVTAKEALPLVTAVSGQSENQIHRNAKLEVALPIASEPSLYVAASYVQPLANWPILAPIARSSQYRNQIHTNEKIEITN